MKPEDIEEWNCGRKEEKMERKRAIAQDRSKYKKSDHSKYLLGLDRALTSKLSKHVWQEGRVLSIIPQGIVVHCGEEQLCCTLKGLLKKNKTRAKNLVAVGDLVLFEKIAPSEGIISHVLPRHTILSRADNLSRRNQQILAVNVDQVLITASVLNPPLKPAIIDRYIIAACKGAMQPVIVINKIDLLESVEESLLLDEQKLCYEELQEAYAAVNIPLIGVSAIETNGMEALKEIMRDKTSVFSGPSGVGKSSLINVLTGLNLRTGEVVEKTKKGSHTTTTTQLLSLPFGGWCVDTPGIKSFGVWDLQLEEIENYFTEIHALGAQCKFANCSHLHEEDCAVIAAVEVGTLSPWRYDSYQALRHSVGQQHVRR